MQKNEIRIAKLWYVDKNLGPDVTVTAYDDIIHHNSGVLEFVFYYYSASNTDIPIKRRSSFYPTSNLLLMEELQPLS